MTKEKKPLAEAILDVVYAYDGVTIADAMGALEAAKFHIVLAEVMDLGADDEDETVHYFDGTGRMN